MEAVPDLTGREVETAILRDVLTWARGLFKQFLKLGQDYHLPVYPEPVHIGQGR